MFVPDDNERPAPVRNKRLIVDIKEVGREPERGGAGHRLSFRLERR